MPAPDLPPTPARTAPPHGGHGALGWFHRRWASWRHAARLLRADRRPAAWAGAGPAAGGALQTRGPCLGHVGLASLIAPLLRAGWRPDMAATDRLAGRIVFSPRDLATAAGGLSEQLQLSPAWEGGWRLTRTLIRADSPGGEPLRAHHSAEGADLALLWRRLSQVPPEQVLGPSPGRPATGQQADADEAGCHALDIVLRNDGRWPAGGEMRTALARLQCRVPVCGGGAVSASLRLTLHRGPDQPPAPVPDDLLTVLGWDWSPLRREGAGFIGSVRLHGEADARLEDLRAKLQHAGRHLAQALAEPPARFHERLAPARRAAALRRALPLLASGLLLAEALMAAPLHAERGHWAVMLMLALPPALLLWACWRTEEPRFEWPRWPRR